MIPIGTGSRFSDKLLLHPNGCNILIVKLTDSDVNFLNSSPRDLASDVFSQAIRFIP